jgi:hypothetical protein
MRFFAAFSMTAGALSMSFVSKKKGRKNASALIFGFHFPRYEMLTWLAARCADCPRYLVELVIKKARILEEPESLVAPGARY